MTSASMKPRVDPLVGFAAANTDGDDGEGAR